jgi:AcrR family transcriptional regulator
VNPPKAHGTEARAVPRGRCSIITEQNGTREQAAEGSKRTRIPIDERRAQVIDAALIEFGKAGYEGTSTSVIAKRAGIQQPYIYAMFENKTELFLACHEVFNQRLTEVLTAASKEADTPEEKLQLMRRASWKLLETEEWAQFQLHVLAASGNKELGEPAQEGFDQLFEETREISGADELEVAQFFATTIMVPAIAELGGRDEIVEELANAA